MACVATQCPNRLARILSDMAAEFGVMLFYCTYITRTEARLPVATVAELRAGGEFAAISLLHLTDCACIASNETSDVRDAV